MRIKICGITQPEDACFAEEAGADAIGVVLFSESKRSVPPEKAREIFEAVGPFVARVAVSHTTSEEDLAEILDLHPTAIQIFHPFIFRQNPGVKVIRVVPHGDPIPVDCDAIIIDESHGGGKLFDPASAGEIVCRSKVPVILAGGLTAENVRDAIRRVHPYAVDVASGVEVSLGIKDHGKIRAFIAACRSF